MLYNIQFLRFVAAMLVVLYHTAARVPATDSLFQGVFSLGSSVGFAGVDIFFVISGFIMAHTTHKHAGTTNSLDFARRRLARIFSGYWPFFILALVIFVYLRPDHFAESSLLESFFLWPQPLNRNLLEITWTLSYELYFYLLFSLLILFFSDRARRISILLITGILLVYNLYHHLIAHSFSPENFYHQPFWWKFLSSPFLLEFFAGALISFWVTRKPTGLAWSMLAVGTMLFLAGGWINESLYAGLIEQGFHVLPRVFVFGLPACLMVAGLVRIESLGIRAPARFSVVVGGSSYAIYLSHILILTLVWNTGFNELVSSWPAGSMLGAYIMLMLFIAGYSALHYSFLEKPLHRQFKRLLRV